MDKQHTQEYIVVFTFDAFNSCGDHQEMTTLLVSSMPVEALEDYAEEQGYTILYRYPVTATTAQEMENIVGRV